MTPKQQRFVDEYLVDLNGKQAAIRAGYAERTAETAASKLLRQPAVAAAVMRARWQQQERTEVTADAVLSWLAAVAFSDIRAFLDSQGRLRGLCELSSVASAALSSVDVLRQTSHRVGRVRTSETVIRIRLCDKLRALELLAKRFGLLKERVEFSGLGDISPLVVERMTDEELERAIAISRRMREIEREIETRAPQR